MPNKHKFILIFATTFLCLMFLSQTALAFTYPKSQTERTREALGSKPSWVSGFPIVSRVIWELKYPREYHLDDKVIRYRYREIVIVVLVGVGAFVFVLAPVILAVVFKKKKRKIEDEAKASGQKEKGVWGK